MAKKQIVKKIFLIIFLFGLQKCANQLPPPGGEVDKTPPTVIETYPQNGTTNFKDNHVEITFSEYVNKRSIRTAVFVSPIIDGVLEYSWTNKTVDITFPDSLRKNTTYSIIIGTEVKDVNNNNPMASPFTLTFSTGSKIDSGKISGKVYSGKTEGVMIFAYKNKSDTLDILKQKPDYISQVDEKGKFLLTGLGIGDYKVFAIQDEFKNYVYNIGEDRIGIQSGKIKIKNGTDIISGVNFFLMKEDTLEPHIQKVTMTDRNHLTIEFNEAVDSSKLKASNFFVYDSTKNTHYEIKYLFKNKGKNRYVLVIADSLNPNNDYYLNAQNIYDKNLNKLNSESLSFTVSEKPDTSAPSLLFIKTKYSGNTIDFLSPEFELYFNDAFDFAKAKQGVKFITKDSSEVPVSLDIIDDAAVHVKLNTDLQPRKKYFVVIDENYFEDIAGNKADTTIRRRILTIGKLDFTGALGKITSGKERNIKVVLKPLQRGIESVQMETNNKNEFEFNRVIPGEYLLWAYDDRDSNNAYTFGTVNPFKYSEKFVYYPDTLKLKARWPVGDIRIDFK